MATGECKFGNYWHGFGGNSRSVRKLRNAVGVSDFPERLLRLTKFGSTLLADVTKALLGVKYPGRNVT